MTRQIIAMAFLLAVSGCGKSLQRDVYTQLAGSFKVPEAAAARDQFYTALKQRCDLPDDAVIISYDHRTAPFVIDDKEFYVSAGVTVRGLARSPSKSLVYMIHEEWYTAQHNWKSLLLRRSVICVDERSNEARPTMDEVARQTVFDNSTGTASHISEGIRRHVDESPKPPMRTSAQEHNSLASHKHERMLSRGVIP